MAFIRIAAGHVHTKQEKTIVALVRERRALKRETAQPLPDLSKMQRRFLENAVGRGTVRLVVGSRYYLDEDALRDLHSRQRAIAFAFVVVASGIAAAWLLIH
jgi:hypothetical protein